MKTTYIAGTNMPGYMPDSEPFAHDSFDDAKRDIIDRILRDAEEAETEEQAEELTAFAEDVNLQSDEFSGICCNRCYWAMTEGV